MKKITYSVLASTLVMSSAYAGSPSTSAPDHSGYYIGVAANTTTLSGQQKSDVKNVDGGTVTGYPGGKTSTETGFGGSLFAGYKINISRSFSIIPELGVEKDSAKNTFSLVSAANDNYSSTLKRRFSAYLNAILSFDVTESFSLQVPFGVKYASFKYTVSSSDNTASQGYSAHQNSGAIGFTLGFGVEQRFECFSLGATLSHSIYESSRIQATLGAAAGEDKLSTKVPAETQFSVRFKLPFASL